MPRPSRSHPTAFWTFSLLLILTACIPGAGSTGTPLPTPSQFVLATIPPNPTVTPTPFQPLGIGESPQPTLTPVPTDILVPTNTPAGLTPDFNGILTFTPPPYIPPNGSITPMPPLTDQETVTFLLLGSDMRLGQSFRTDSIVIAAVRPKLGQVTLISIPRDLWIYIPTLGMNRINTAYENGEMSHYPGGGSALLRDTIYYNLGIRIDHVAIVDFDGFRRIIDTLGGIDVPVYCAYTDWHLKSPDLNPEEENNWELYTVGPGMVHMDGYLALWYARSRKKSSDFDRGRRQQEVLRAIYTKGLQLGVVSKIPQLYENFKSTVQTDVGLGTMVELAPLALHLSNADIRSYYISPPLVTGWTSPGGGSVLLPNGPAIQAMLQEALSPSRKTEVMESITIEVWNGTLNNGWDALAAERLNYAGYETHTAPADNHNHAQTLLYDLTASQEVKRSGSLLAILGLQPPALVSAPGYRDDVDYVLIVGSDYQPCFKPQNMAP